MDENVDPAKLGGCARLCWGLVLVWGVWAPAWGVGPAGLLVRALGKYVDPAGNVDPYGPQNPAHGVLKFPGTVRPRGLSAQGVTSDLATCGPVQDVLVQGILDKIHHLGLWLGVD